MMLRFFEFMMPNLPVGVAEDLQNIALLPNFAGNLQEFCRWSPFTRVYKQQVREAGASLL